MKGDLIVFHAGSLAVPIREAAEEFEHENPGVRVLSESAGSRTCARKISDLGRRCDVMVSADYSVIEELLMPDHTGWYLAFAGNEMTIAYTDRSRRSGEIDRDNWFSILLDPDVVFGRSDPNADPCGYRAVFTMDLAEEYYGVSGLKDLLYTKDQRHIRPKEVDLLALLETGDIDYIFIYRSIAHQHGLRYLQLPDDINLRSADLKDYYGKVSIELSGKSPGTFLTRRCVPIAYGITMPYNAPNRELAITFIEFLMDKEKGMAILQRNGFSPISPARTNARDRLPETLKKYTE